MHHRRSRRNVRPSSPRTPGGPLQFETLEPRRVLSGVAELLLDVNATSSSDNNSSRPQEYVVVGDDAYFWTASAGLSELWRTDGTEAGTTRIRTFQVGRLALTNVDGILYFTASEFSNNEELWRTDGTTAGTWLVKDIHSTGSSSPTAITNVDGTLYFSANDGLHGVELWKSDGTAAGTTLAYDFAPGIDGSLATPKFNYNGSLVFSARGVDGKFSLYLDDASPSPPALLGTFASAMPNGPFAAFTPAGSTLYFTASQGSDGSELWQTDGTAAGTARVADFDPFGVDAVSQLTNVNGTLFFNAYRSTIDGYELWKSDGTAVGALLVKDIRIGPGSSHPDHLVNANGVLYFRANDGVNGFELWRSDGTAAGTTLVADIRAGLASSSPSYLVNASGVLYLAAETAEAGRELWKLEGSAVSLVSDVVSGVSGSNPNALANFNGKILFNAASGYSGSEPWISDGLSANTKLIKDIRVATRTSNSFVATEVNGIHYFAANDGIHGFELWQTDGTTAGTHLVKDIKPGYAYGVDAFDARYFANVNGRLYFSANDGANGRELWTSDGTAIGTKLVKDIYPGAVSGAPRHLANVDGILYFTANDASGAELWRSDGTDVGTVKVADLAPGIASSLPAHFTVVDGALYFTAVTPTLGYELWKIPAGASTPVQLTSFPYDAIKPNATTLTVVGDKVFFNAYAGSNELWVADSTGVRRVVATVALSTPSTPPSMVNVNGILFFAADSAASGRELWRSDGTSEGTFQVLDVNPGQSSSFPRELINVGGVLFFTAVTLDNGTELWKSDGTAAGTVLAADIIPGPNSSSPLTPGFIPQYVVIDDWLYFAARPQLSGNYGIYRINASSPGAILITDAYVLADRTGPRPFVNLNGDLAFIPYDTYGVGAEIHVLRQSAIAQSGDYTSDGAVDGDDFLAWQRGFNTRVEPFGSGADGSGNGVVNGFDLDVWKGNYGKQIAAAEPVGLEAAVVAAAAEATESDDAPLAALDAAFATVAAETIAPTASSGEAFRRPLAIGAAALTLRQTTLVETAPRLPQALNQEPSPTPPSPRHTPALQVAAGQRPAGAPPTITPHLPSDWLLKQPVQQRIQAPSPDAAITKLASNQVAEFRSRNQPPFSLT